MKTMPALLPVVSLVLLLLPATVRSQDTTAPSAPETNQLAPIGTGSAGVLKSGEGMTIRVPLDTGAVINGSYAIDSAGFATIPILGRLYVHNRSVAEVEEYIGSKLSKYLRDTHIMVYPVIRLTLIGHWQRPGMHYVNPETSVWEACLAVGGPLTEANIMEWHVMRGPYLTEVRLLREFSKGSTLRAAGVRSGDIFIIPTPDPESGFWYWFRESLTITAQIATIATVAMTAYLTYLTLEETTNQP